MIADARLTTYNSLLGRAILILAGWVALSSCYDRLSRCEDLEFIDGRFERDTARGAHFDRLPVTQDILTVAGDTATLELTFEDGGQYIVPFDVVR